MTQAPSRPRALTNRAQPTTPSMKRPGSTPPEESVILNMSVLDLVSSEVSARLAAAAEANRVAGLRVAPPPAAPIATSPTGDEDLEDEEDEDDEDDLDEDEDLEDEDEDGDEFEEEEEEEEEEDEDE